MKNPNSIPLQILWKKDPQMQHAAILSQLAIAESNLVKGGKDSAMPHFIAIVKEIEKVCGFKFEKIEEPDDVKE
jgi:hypothetical protein